ncbi:MULTISPECIES: LPS export ABC transporter ATP-binding protein [Sphingomonadales]|jgi:lipopolysaccharide export system ATP-binding protein|uniref:Lipopolysaccharide export system ATP-binding protein n=7 Tax=Sphingomonadaceae TaxID=41297 RepID=A0A7W6BN08_9SPHN|nr:MULTISPECIES: LPS export ABC transporter ATP-binding protein [Sphingomonadales]ALR21366.1 LPS export ABC transporter ATP-binding protein [Sphingobium baderi]ARR57604.1 LPS export ABC transporter ATP-binding protein [Rhizorhabdus wittichii DC-6]ATE66100.1 LPS export ABC transporter ATP-binding protein [Rhizorhabdus dicambivorans]EZP71280.1 putative ABC transporter ATP-binding protein [Sphingomonas paucimobilis]KEQ55638.1 putative ABC transporter ATP-binding protein [Sphingobium chlorophenoli
MDDPRDRHDGSGCAGAGRPGWRRVLTRLLRDLGGNLGHDAQLVSPAARSESEPLAPASIGPVAVERAPTVLSIAGIEKSFGKRKVLDDVALEVRAGEIVGLLGPNGAGKTLCFYAIAGLMSVDAGRIEIGGQDVTALPMDRRAKLGLGYLPQEGSIFRGMTAAENIAAVLELHIADRDVAAARLDELLAEFNIAHIRDVPAQRLSGGERRRCEIARAMAAAPSVILLDEPFAGIDPMSIADVKAMVRKLKREGVAILLTDHNVHEMLELVERAYIIDQGRMLFEGGPEAVLDNPEVRHRYLGEGFRM